MTDVSQELLHELLRRLHQRVDKVDGANRDLRAENNSLRRIVTAHQSDVDNFYELIHRIEDRIEARLDLREFSEAPQSSFEPGN